MAAYPDLTFYSGTFLGVLIPSGDFPRLALRASAVLDQITFDRVAPIITAGTETAQIEKIKMAVCAIAELMYSFEVAAASSSAGIKSETLGNHSVTYIDSSETLTADEQYYMTAREYLGNTGLMYRGF